MSESRFHPLFEKWAGRIRRRLVVRGALTGAALGFALALIPAIAGWRLHAGYVRWLAPGLGLVGAAAGAIVVSRARWSDSEVALFLDARLGTDEAIVTAVELRNVAELDSPTRNAVVSVAGEALGKAETKKVAPRLWVPFHGLIPAAAAALVAVAVAPMPVKPMPKVAPGSGLVTSKDVEQLKRLAELGKVQARDEAQRKRLDEIAKAAEALRKDLDKGLPKRDALDRIARLRDAIAKERLSLGEGESRQGMDSAMSKLNESGVTRDASKALGDHDMQRFDDEMERIANEREKVDRETAKKKLDEAITEARKNGAEDVAKALENSKKNFDAREKRSQALRDLADSLKGMGGAEADEVEKQADALDRKGTDEAARKLAEAMGKALEKLTPEERERLKKNIQKKLDGKGGSGGSDPQSMKDLAEDLSTPEGQKKLEEKLKELAKEEDESDESKTDKSLDDAEKDAEGAEKELGKQPGQEGQGQQGQGQQGQGQQGQGQQGQGQQGQGQQGQGQQGQGQQGQGQQGQGQQGQWGLDGVPLPMPGGGGHGGSGDSQGGEQNGAGGGGRGGGPTNKGKGKASEKVDAETFRAKAHGKMNKSPGMPGGTQQGSMPGRASGKSRAELSGDLSTVGPKEIDGVTHGDIPEEYRDQVREYFQP